MIKLLISVSLFLLSLSSFSLLAQESPKALNIEHTDITKNFGEQLLFESEILLEKRELLIHIPKGYKGNTNRYPVIYVLDGQRHFYHTIIASQFLADAEKIPPSIVVGITNNTGQRMRDTNLGQDKFRQFLQLEVMTLINKRLRTSEISVLFGHSAMGAVVLKTVASNQQAFTRFIVSSAAVDANESTLNQSLTASLQQLSSDASIYLSAGATNREGSGFVQGLQNIVQVLKEHANKNVKWKHERFYEQNHSSVAYLAMFNGLSFLFADYEAPAITDFKQLQAYGGLSALNRFFRARGERYQSDKNIPISMITRLAFAFWGEQKPEEAIKLLNKSITAYKDPARIYGALAFIYEQQKALGLALNMYQRALELSMQYSQNHEATIYYRHKVKELTGH